MDEESTLFDFYKDNQLNSYISKTAINFLKEIEEKQKVLIIGHYQKEIEDYIKKNKIKAKVFCIPKTENNKSDYKKIIKEIYLFLKKEKANEFELVLDLGFSSYLQKQKLKRHYVLLSKVLKFKGCLITLALSINSKYCKEHCPKRLWTYMDNQYVKFFTKKETERSIKGSFKTISYEHNSFSNKSYHEIISVNAVMKLQ